MNKLRLFIAIDIDKDGLNKISHFQSSLKNKTDAIRWTHQETWHLTIKFLGVQNKYLLEQIIDICKTSTNTLEPFSLNIKAAGAFPNVMLPRVIFLNIEQSDNLFKLYTHLSEQLSLLGIPKEDRPFSPHITLGRIKEPRLLFLKSPTFMQFFLDSGKNFSHTFPVTNFCLYQSILKREGPEYSVIENFSF